MRSALRDPIALLPRNLTPADRAPGTAAAKLWPRPVSGDDHDGGVTPRRPRARPGRFRRRRLLGWLKRLAWTLGIVGSPVAAVMWLYHSPRFALETIEIVFVDGDGVPATGSSALTPTLSRNGRGRHLPPSYTSGRVPETWVRETVAPYAGGNLLRLSLTEIGDRLEVHPWVKSVGLSKDLPSRLWVRIVERREVALLRDGRDLSFLDRDGEVIAPVEGPPPPLVEIELVGPWPRPQSALALLRELEDAGPAWLGGLQQILVLEENDFVLSTTELPYPLLVRSGTVADKIHRLQELLPVIMAHTGAGAAIDLRFEQRIIIQPSAGRGVGGVLAKRFAGTASGRHS